MELCKNSSCVQTHNGNLMYLDFFFTQRVLMCHSNTVVIPLSLILTRKVNTILLTHGTARNQVLVAIFCFVKNSTMWLICSFMRVFTSFTDFLNLCKWMLLELHIDNTVLIYKKIRDDIVWFLLQNCRCKSINQLFNLQCIHGQLFWKYKTFNYT